MNNKKRLKIFIIILILIILFFFIKFDGIEYIKNREQLETLFNGLGIWAPIIYILLYSLVTITTITTLPLTIASGLLFGPIYGIVYTLIGATFGMISAFLIARYLAKEFVERKTSNLDILTKINKGVKNDGWVILAITRLLPIFPFGIQNYLYGLTSISLIKYTLFSMLFILPGTSIYILLAGAVASGNIKEASKISLIASFIFLGLTFITKIIQKKLKIEKKGNS